MPYYYGELASIPGDPDAIDAYARSVSAAADRANSVILRVTRQVNGMSYAGPGARELDAELGRWQFAGAAVVGELREIAAALRSAADRLRAQQAERARLNARIREQALEASRRALEASRRAQKP